MKLVTPFSRKNSRTTESDLCDYCNTYTRILLFLVVLLIVSSTVHAQIDLDESGGTSNLIELDLNEILDMSFTSAGGTTERLFTMPLSATVLTSDEIKRSGAMSIPEALRLIPGLIVREQTPGNFDVHIRGFDAVDPRSFLYQLDNSISLVMVDNRPINFEAHGNIPWNTLPVGINEIDRIEVIRGPAPAQYLNPASGVIHIITKKPIDQVVGLSGGITGYQSVNNHATIASASVNYNSGKKFAIKVHGNFDSRRRHNIDYWKFTEKSNSILGNATVKGHYVGLPSDTVLNYFGLPYKALLTSSNSGDRVSSAYPDPALSLQYFNTGFDMQGTIDNLEARISGGYSKTNSQRIFGENFTYALTTDSIETSFCRLALAWQKFTFSLDYTFNSQATIGMQTGSLYSNVYTSMFEYKNEISRGLYLQVGTSVRSSVSGGRQLGTDTLDMDYGIYRPGRATVSNSMAALYVRADYSVSNWRFVGAIRGEKYKDPNQVAILPQFSATYLPHNDIAFRATVSRGARAPYTYTLYSMFNTAARTVDSIDNFLNIGPKKISFEGRATTRGNVNQRLLTIDNIDFGFRWNASSSISFDVEAFYMIMRNPTVHMTDSISLDLTYLPSGSVSSTHMLSYQTLDFTSNLYGATLSLTWQATPSLYVRGYATSQTSWLENYPIRDTVSGGLTGSVQNEVLVTSTPRIICGVEVNYVPFHNANLNLNSYYYGSQVLNNTRYDSFAIESNAIVNAAFSYQVIGGTKILLNARNLLGGGKRQYGMADIINTVLTAGIQCDF